MTAVQGEPQPPGRVEAAVLRELAALGGGYRDSALGEMALVMGRAMDAYTARAMEGTPAEMSALAKAHQELRVTLGVLKEVAARGSGDSADAAHLSTPVWSGGAAARDPSDTGAPDAGAARGGDSAAPG